MTESGTYGRARVPREAVSLRVVTGIPDTPLTAKKPVCAIHATRNWVEFMAGTMGAEPITLTDPATRNAFMAFRVSRDDPPKPADLRLLLADASWVGGVTADNTAAQRVRDITGRPWRPCLFVTFPGMATFPVPDIDPPVSHLVALIGQIIRYAAETGCRTVAFPYVVPEAANTLTALRLLGLIPLVESFRADLAVHPDGLEGHLASLSKTARHQVRRDLRQLASMRIHTSEEPVSSSLIDLMAQLRCRYKLRYGIAADEAAERRRAEDLLARFDGVTVFVSRQGSRPLRFSLFVKHDSAWHALWTGADYTLAAHRSTYFDALFYEPLRSAGRVGVTEITYGLGGDEGKRRRGCILRPVRCFAKTLVDAGDLNGLRRGRKGHVPHESARESVRSVGAGAGPVVIRPTDS